MREFLKHNFKTIVQIVAVLLLVILLVRSFTSIPDRSELLKYKLDQLDNNIDSLKKIQLKYYNLKYFLLLSYGNFRK